MKKQFNLHIISAFLLMVVFIAVLLFGGVGVSYAATSNYSNVLDDLRKDENFDFNDYPNVDNDFSLQVIQIAESMGGELFLYVYQPAAHYLPLTATSVNMSLSEEVDGTALFHLSLVSSEGVLQKYRVDGVRVSSDEVRYYNITSIYRDWIKGIDEETGNDNIDKEVYFPVSKIFTASTSENGEINYSCKDTEVVQIIDPYVDFLAFGHGVTWSNFWGSLLGITNYTDVHYIAFSTDLKIDILEQADVTYTTQSYYGRRGDYSYGSVSEPQYKTLTKEDYGTAVDGAVEWKCIQKTEDFIKTAGLTGAAKTEVEKSQYVLIFLQTPFSTEQRSSLSGHYNYDDGTKVSHVSILRLQFETDGVSYNLGAVMDKLEGDDIAGNKPEPFDFWAWLSNLLGIPEWAAKLIVYGIGALIILAPILIVLSSVFPVVGQVLSTILKDIGAVFKYFFLGLFYVLKYLFMGLWWIVSLPFKGIAALVHKIRGD